MKDGAQHAFDNNGNGYPVQDGIVIQKQQSCLLQTSGTFTLTTAVRNDLADQPVAATIQYKTKRETNPTHLLSEMALPLTKGNCVGAYTLFTGSTTIPGGLSASSVLDVAVGSYKELFRSVSDIGGSCRQFTGTRTCETPGVPSSISSPPRTSSTSAATSSGIVTSSSAVSNRVPSSEIVTSTTGGPHPVSSTAFSSSSSSSVTISSANIVTTQSLQHRPNVGGYELVACWTEGAHSRALKGASFAYDGMTLESCMANCTGFAYWGTEYGRECYCGNSLDGTSAEAPLTDCDVVCSGDQTQYCGGGNRLELYSTTATVSAPTPTATLAHLPTLGVYNLVGCWKEGRGARAIDARTTASVDMTLTKCKEFCDGYEYFGTEYGRECKFFVASFTLSLPFPFSFIVS